MGISFVRGTSLMATAISTSRGLIHGSIVWQGALRLRRGFPRNASALLVLCCTVLSCGGPAQDAAAPQGPNPALPIAKPAVHENGVANAADAVIPVAAQLPESKQANRSSATGPLSTAQIVARSEQSVALIKGKRSLGTGFLVRPGILATNAHVIEGELVQNLEIHFPSAKDELKGPIGAVLLAKNTKRDLAFLKVKTDLPPLEVADSYQYQKGDDLLVIGNPGAGDKLVLENAVSRGVMSTKAVIDGQNFYQLGIAINPGNSGGPVIDSAGKVIGVATLKSSKLEATAFCIPVDDLRAELAQAESQPAQAVASATPARASARELRYGWKPGQTYVYSVRIALEVGKTLITLDGSSIYKVRLADEGGITLAHRGWLSTRKQQKDQ